MWVYNWMYICYFPFAQTNRKHKTWLWLFLFRSSLLLSCLCSCRRLCVLLSRRFDVSASRPLLVNKLYCLVNWSSICRKFSGLWESCLSMVFIHVGLGTVPCINSAREFTRVTGLCCLVNWLFICRRFSRLWESCLSMVFIHVGLVRFLLSGPCLATHSAREFTRVHCSSAKLWLILTPSLICLVKGSRKNFMGSKQYSAFSPSCSVWSCLYRTFPSCFIWWAFVCSFSPVYSFS